MPKTYTQEELDAIVKEKSELSYKAGVEKTTKKNESLISSNDKYEELQRQLQEKEEALKKLENETKPLKEKQLIQTTTEAFIKAGGKKGIDITDYNYSKYKNDKGEIVWDEFLTKHESLKESKKIISDPSLDDDLTKEDYDNAKLEIEKQRSEVKFENV